MNSDPDCLACRHFRVTWRAARPHACLVYGFETRELPARVVRRETQEPCRAFERRHSPDGGRPRSGFTREPPPR